MDKFYWGYREDDERWELFTASNPKEATPEASGYDEVHGPYNTKEEAEENDPND